MPKHPAMTSEWAAGRLGAIVTLTMIAMHVLPFVLLALFCCAMFAQAMRYRLKQRAYLRRLPSVDGIPLHMYVPGASSQTKRALYTALRGRQSDPELELERLRRDVRGNGFYLVAIDIGTPILVMLVILLLFVVGVIHG